MPHLNYGLLLWGPHLGRLVTLQKKAIRVVSHSDYLSHTDLIFKELKLVTLEDMFTYKNSNFCTNWLITHSLHILTRINHF